MFKGVKTPFLSFDKLYSIHLRNDYMNDNVHYDTSYFDVITIKLLESCNSEAKPLCIRSYNETTT
jgi:hypothetical protein